jgi:hypothetical protein
MKEGVIRMRMANECCYLITIGKYVISTRVDTFELSPLTLLHDIPVVNCINPVHHVLIFMSHVCQVTFVQHCTEK